MKLIENSRVSMLIPMRMVVFSSRSILKPASKDTPIDISKPENTTIVTRPVGLLNVYEYAKVVSKDKPLRQSVAEKTYLKNGVEWWLLNEAVENYEGEKYFRGWGVASYGMIGWQDNYFIQGIRPVINLKNSVKIVSGSGTADNPYRLEGDYDTNLSGTLISSRYSGEYIKIGDGMNSLYQIVSKEGGDKTKITSIGPLRDDDGSYYTPFGNGASYEDTFLYLESELPELLPAEISGFLEDNNTWYLGTIYEENYRLTKYTDINMSQTISRVYNHKFGLLRYGELMARDLNIDANDQYSNDNDYTLLTRRTDYENEYYVIYGDGTVYSVDDSSFGLKPAMFLKAGIKIESGTGTKSDPFTLTLGS